MRSNSGFTLVEVALATLALGLGLLAVFSLLPFGLQMAEDDRVDTQCSEFVEVVMNGLHGQVSDFSTWSEYTNLSVTLVDVFPGLVAGGTGTNELRFPAPSGGLLWYKLTLGRGASPSATLTVYDGKFSGSPMVQAYTEFVYQGD